MYGCSLYLGIAKHQIEWSDCDHMEIDTRDYQRRGSHWREFSHRDVLGPPPEGVKVTGVSD